MKFTKVFAVVLIVMLAFSGCTKKNNNGTTGNAVTDAVSEAVQDTISGAEDMVGMNPSESTAEEGVVEEEVADNSGGATDEVIPEGEEVTRGRNANRNLNDGRTLAEQPIAAAMSTDFAEIGALDSTKQSGFPGGTLDEKNRPSGPLQFQEKYKDLGAYFIMPDSNDIYLTFDEGYENGYTKAILDTLKEKKVKAIFFITYDYAKGQPDLVRRMIDEGHVVGNHSTKHKSFPDLSVEEAAKDIQTTHEYVKEQFGYEMYLFRYPMGEFSEQSLALLQSLGYKSVFWSFAYLDYDVNNQPITIEATDKIVSKAHPGAIYLLHAVSKTNSMVLGECIDLIRDKGYDFAILEK